MWIRGELRDVTLVREGDKGTKICSALSYSEIKPLNLSRCGTRVSKQCFESKTVFTVKEKKTQEHISSGYIYTPGAQYLLLGAVHS